MPLLSPKVAANSFPGMGLGFFGGIFNIIYNNVYDINIFNNVRICPKSTNAYLEGLCTINKLQLKHRLEITKYTSTHSERKKKHPTKRS